MIAGFGCPKLGLTPFHEWKRNRILHFIYKAYIKMQLSVNFQPLWASFWNDSFKHLGRHKKCANHFFSLLYVERIAQFSCHFEVHFKKWSWNVYFWCLLIAGLNSMTSASVKNWGRTSTPRQRTSRITKVWTAFLYISLSTFQVSKRTCVNSELHARWYYWHNFLRCLCA